MSSQRRPRQGSARILVATAVMLAVALSGLGAGPAAGAQTRCPEPASSVAPIDRVAGADRYATAACTSQATYPEGADRVVLARGDATGGLADALAGAVLAHAVDGPVLLTAPTALPAATRAELVRLSPSRVTVLGGEPAVSSGVAAAVATALDGAATVDRVAGADRAATAARVAQAAGARGTAFVVNGFRPADALVAAAPAARAGAKLLMVSTNDVPASTRTALDGVDRVVVVGGYGVVSARVEAALRSAVGREVRRVAGANRGETAASVARAYPAGGRAYLAAQSDGNLVDAVTAGWAAARPGGGPVLYVDADRPGRAADRWLRLGGLAGRRPARLVGGPKVLTPALVTVLERRYAEARRGGPPAEVRGMWVHLFDASLKSREGIHRVLDAAATSNANTVVVQVARRQDAYYRSTVLPRTPDPQLEPGLDILAALIPAAHDRGLDVHAWVSVLPAYHSAYDTLRLPADHVWRLHGPSSADPWVTRTREGATSVYLDPGVPAVQTHVARVMSELAGGYDVDAVHIDYLRYDGAQWGYHPTSLARFRQATGTSGTPSNSDPQWNAWRRQQTRDLARRVARDVAAADPDVAVSMAASTMGPGPAASGGYQRTRTYRDVFQDWPAWLAEGTVDAAFPMNYFREDDAQQRAWYDDWTTWQQGLPKGGGRLAVGQGSFLNTPQGSLAQVADARARSHGVVLFSYQQTTSAGAGQQLLGRLAATQWAAPAPAPEL